MMSALAYFNTLDYVNILVQANFSRQQAEALNKAQIMAIKAVITHVATPADLDNLRLATQNDLQKLDAALRAKIQEVYSELKAEIQEVRTELKAEIQEVHTELKAEIQELRTELKAEIQEVRTEIQQVEHRLQKEIHKAMLYGIGINVSLISLVFGISTFILLNH